jgi:hypothetical protein
MSTLYFEKLSQFERQTEPVTVSIPFAAESLTDESQLVVIDGDQEIPAQARALAAWQDGSIKWLLVHIQPDLPGNRDKTLQFRVAERCGTAAGTTTRMLLEAGNRIESQGRARSHAQTEMVVILRLPHHARQL